LTRKEHLRVDLFGTFAFKQIQNFALGHQTSYDRLRVFTTGFIIDHSNRYGRDYVNIRAKIGIPDFLGGLGAAAQHSSRPPAGGRFIACNVDYDRLQPVQKDCFLSVHASGQYSPYNLTVPEQIYLGGGDTVRGFPLAAALGHSGYFINLEARIPPPFLAQYNFLLSKKKWKEVLQIVGFLDQGGAFPQSGPNVFLFGTGLGFRVKGPGSLSLTLDIGFPLNHPDLSSGTFTYIKLTGHPF
jgi:hemolysin activation/secretion protein